MKTKLCHVFVTKYLVTQDSFSIKLMLGFLKSCLFLDSTCLKEIFEPLQRIIYLGIMNIECSSFKFYNKYDTAIK